MLNRFLVCGLNESIDRFEKKVTRSGRDEAGSSKVTERHAKNRV